MTIAKRENLSVDIPAAGSFRLTRKALYDRNRTLAAFDEAAARDISRIRFWNQDVVLVNRDRLIHEVLVTEADAFRKGPLLTRNARPVLGKGLLSSDNDLNRRQRKIISPAFAHRKIPEYAGLVVDQTSKISSRWTDGEVLDIPTVLLAITFEITDRLLFGGESGKNGADRDEILKSLPVLMNFAVDQLRSPLHAARALPSALGALIRLHMCLNRRMSARRGRGQPETEAESDLLDALLIGHGENDRDAMPMSLVRDEAMTTFLAGLETVAMGIAWTLYLLVMNPATLARAEREVDAIGHTPGYDDLANAPFALQAFKEALRLYPPAYILARQAIREVMIGGYRIERGSVVFVSPYLRHRDPEAFTDPSIFDPERWTAPNFERSLPRYSYMPFGGGQHVCVGGHFALMQGHLILVTLLQRFRFELVDDQTIEPEPLFTLRPRNGIRMRMHRR